MSIYIIKSKIHSNVKIGYSKNAEKRLKQIQFGNQGGDNTCYLVSIFHGLTIKDETILHNFFHKYNVRETEGQEWFSSEILKYIYSFVYVQFGSETKVEMSKKLKKQLNSMILIYKSEINENKLLNKRELEEYSRIYQANLLFKKVTSCKKTEIEKECKKLFSFLSSNTFKKEGIYFSSIKKEVMTQKRKNIKDYRFFYNFIIKQNIDSSFNILQNSGYFNNELFFEYLAFYINKSEKNKKNISKKAVLIYNFVGNNIKEIFKSRDYILGRYENLGVIKKNTYTDYKDKKIELDPSVSIETSNVFEAIDLEKKAKILKSSILPILYLLNETKYYIKRGYGTYLSESINLCEELNIDSRYIM